LTGTVPTVHADEPAAVAETNTFPSVAEVIGGRTFDSKTEEDVYFLRAIHDRYAAHWSELVEANVTLNDYVLNAAKLERFIDELGEAMQGRDDAVARTNLAMITGDPTFYANTNAYNAELEQAAARALIELGPTGGKALAATFNVDHYRSDPGSLEDLADAIGQAQPADSEFTNVLAAAAFDFSTGNGAIYPRCTTAMVKNLLALKGGAVAVRAHLKIDEVLGNPGRFQAVMDGIAAAQAKELAPDLTELETKVKARLADPTLLENGYKDDLRELDRRITQTLATVSPPATGR
jgi:hypothetical protein